MVEQSKRWPPESTLRLHGRDGCSCEDIAEAIEETSGVVAHGLSDVLFALVQLHKHLSVSNLMQSPRCAWTGETAASMRTSQRP